MKRSSQVALLLMGAGVVSSTAYAAVPHRDCLQPQGVTEPQEWSCRGDRSRGTIARRHNPGFSPGEHSTTTSRNGFGSIGQAFSGGG